jgi:5-methylthioadenosine/S-adenosylhomocysteine deaminase
MIIQLQKKIKLMAEKTTFILNGRIVTMQSEEKIIEDGYLVIEDGKIAAITNDIAKLPPKFASKKIIHTDGTIYPGLIDLHNHFVYNVLPLWVVPKRYDNRSQWPAHREYKSGVSKPIKQALALYSVSSKALVRYVETKALIGGTTTGQGMRTRVNGGSKIFKGAMRNVEEPGSDILLPAGSMVPDLVVSGATAQERIDSFRKALNNDMRGAYFYHLSEGIDESARKHFVNLKDNDLISEKLVGIHSLGLHKDDLEYLAQKKAKVVWSPFSNQLLYGKTINLKDLKDSGVTFSLGCDWTPSGSKNILQELKVAYHVNEKQNKIFSNYELIQLVTSSAAKVTGWETQLGILEEGKLADILIINGVQADPYMQLIKAIEKEIELVVVDGIARYGESNIMKKLHHGSVSELEEISVGGNQKSLFLYTASSVINDISFKLATETLKDIMSDLPGFLNKMESEKASLSAIGNEQQEEFTIETDNDFEIEADVFQEYEVSQDADLFADVPMADSVELDTAIVEGQDYWDRIEAQKNITNELKAWLKTCYS